AGGQVRGTGGAGRAGGAGAAVTLVARRDAKEVDAITKLTGRDIEWLDGKEAIQSADPADDKPARGRRGEGKSDGKSPARRSGRGDKRTHDEKPQPVAAAEEVAETVAADDIVEPVAARETPHRDREDRRPRQDREDRQPRQEREDRQPRHERDARPAPQRTPEPANANHDR